MFFREASSKFPNDPDNNELDILAVHFSNEIAVQIRFNGELDSTYEISVKGLNGIGKRFLAGHSIMGDDDEDDISFVGDMANYQIATKLGNSNDTKLHVVCTQIAELYHQIILPRNVDGMGASNEDGITSRKILVTLSSKIWRDNNIGKDFDKLIYILQNIKKMYNI
ncbi:hypothetical protein HG535_0A05440 [Zygotorulaspora mrakii]|uniref:Proteasome chaperone 3 n=1 Tax=Zygotorulaspora mrakii TaxID=42260 RepID=A0A7H9AWJ9_ZYGMR|nr:uncharacterized protein HG535_0A05440 [Zygotorulaspora mrakii]QLG70603.1 hypothetical protein HG535_0A05440 [Zygotorulaspora mrakii]